MFIKKSDSLNLVIYILFILSFISIAFVYMLFVNLETKNNEVNTAYISENEKYFNSNFASNVIKDSNGMIIGIVFNEIKEEGK